MNIKRAKEVVIQLCHKAGSPWLRTENVMEILEALDEPMPTNTQGLASYLDGKMISMQMDEINKLKADLAIANGLVKNLEEKNKNLADKISNYWKGGFVAFKEYDELNSNYRKVKEIAEEFNKRLQNVKGILYPNPEKGN